MRILSCIIITLTGLLPTLSSCQSLFESKEILQIRLTGEIRETLDDRDEESSYHQVNLHYTDGLGNEVVIPIEAKTRGNFRKLRSNCIYPPLLLNFSKSETSNTIFQGQKKLKLVTPCRGDKYVLREYMVYQLHNLVTPKSFRARLVKVFYGENKPGKEQEPLYGILLEEEDQMAVRNNAFIVDAKLVSPEHTNTDDFMITAMFEYLIGNTDWSVQYQQNIKLITTDSSVSPSTVPYDFDHAGLVNAPYAKPAEALQLGSVRERRYRGYCIKDMKQFDTVIAHFNSLKENIYGLYSTNPLLDEAYIKSTLKYFDDFYKVINDPKLRAREFQYPCLSSGTGGVIIKGLN